MDIVEWLLKLTFYGPIALYRGRFPISERKALYGVPSSVLGFFSVVFIANIAVALLLNDASDLFVAVFWLCGLGAGITCLFYHQPRKDESPREVGSESGPVVRSRRE